MARRKKVDLQDAEAEEIEVEISDDDNPEEGDQPEELGEPLQAPQKETLPVLWNKVIIGNRWYYLNSSGEAHVDSHQGFWGDRPIFRLVKGSWEPTGHFDARKGVFNPRVKRDLSIAYQRLMEHYRNVT